MLVDNQIYRMKYNCSGTEHIFAIEFPFLDPQHLIVYQRVDGVQSVIPDSQYTITGAGVEAGGTLTLNFTPAAGTILVILRLVPITQLYAYEELDNFPAKSHENALAKLTMICQQLKEAIDRCIKVDPSDPRRPDELIDEFWRIYNDVQTAAENIERWKDEIIEHIGTDLQVIAEGADIPRSLASHLGDVINVRDFGAKGDGVTDDTAAIQAAVNVARNGRLVFPTGIYCISNTITICGNGSGTYIDLSGSTLLWTGADAPEDYTSHITPDMSEDYKRSIRMYGWAYYGTPMIYVAVCNYGLSTRAVIEGGILLGNNRCSIGIKTHGFGTLIHGVRISNMKHCGIAACSSNPAVASSGGVQISDCYIVQQTNMTIGGSATRLNKGLSNDVGIYLYDLDNKIDNCIINFFGEGIAFRSSGNHVANTHITIQIPAVLDPDSNEYYLVDNDGNWLTAYPECSNIIIDAPSTSPSGSNWLTNMYFNSGRYVVFNKQGINMATHMDNCAYFLKSPRVKIRNKETEAVLYSGDSGGVLHANGFIAHHPSYFRFRDYFLRRSITNTFLDTTININHTSNPSGNELITTNFLRSSNWHDPVQLCNSEYPIPANKYALIGCIMSKYSTIDTPSAYNYFDCIEYEICHSHYYMKKGYVTFNSTTDKWQVFGSQVIYQSGGNFELAIDNTPKYKLIEGRYYKYFNLYFGGTAELDGAMFLNLKSRFNLSKIYAFMMHNYSNGTYLNSLPANYTALGPGEIQ